MKVIHLQLPKIKHPILTIDGKPVTNEQTLTYNRDYVVMSQDGQTEKTSQ